MSNDSDLQLNVTANADGVKRGFSDAVRAIMGLEQQANKSGQALDGMGVGAEVSGKKVDKAAQGMINAIKRTTIAVETGGDALKKFERQAEMRGISKDVLRPYLNQLREAKTQAEAAEKATKSWGSSLTPLKTALGGLFVGASIGGFASKLVDVQREFDKLNASLVTVTGSSAAAESEMAWLKTFAKETPFGLAQATEAFVKMKALGLNPTKEALTSFGNTASAMGKDMMQFVEAVADATTGEFERLKEFGIKTSKEGANVSLTFQGVTTTIKNSATEINQYLTDIGNNEFAGAMEQRAKTLDGAISALGDSWDELFRTISSSGIGDTIASTVRSASEALDGYSQVLALVTAYQKEDGQAATGLGESFSYAASAGANLAILTTTASSAFDEFRMRLGGAAAAAAALATDGMEAAKRVIREVDADAHAAANRLAELQARMGYLLIAQANARSQLGADARGGLDAYLSGAVARSDAEKRPAVGGGGGGGGGKVRGGGGGGGSRAKPRDEFQELYKSLFSKTDAGLEKDFYDKLSQLEAGYKKGRISVDEYRGAVEQLSTSHEFTKKVTKEVEDAQKALNEQLEEDRRLRLEMIQADSDKADQFAQETQRMREELEMMGLTEAQIYALRDARIAEQLEVEEAQLRQYETAKMYTAEQAAIERNIQVLKERRDVLGRTREVEKAIKANEAFAASLSEVNDAFKKAFTESTGDIGDMFADLWKSALAGFKNLVYQMTVQPILIQLGASLTGTSYDSMASLMGLSGGNGGGLGGLLGGAQNASSLNSAIGAGVQWWGGGTAGASAASLGYANGIGMLGGDSLGALIAANGNWAGVGAGATAGTGGASAGGASSMGGAAMGGLATFGAVAALFWALEEFGDTRPEFAGYASASSDASRDREAMRYGTDASLDLGAGVLPNRDALLAALAEAGVDPSQTVDQAGHYLSDEQRREMGLNGTLDDLTTQSLYRMLQDAQSDSTRQLSMYGGRVQTPEWYEGAGYVDPASLGHYDTEYNAEMTAFSRQMSESVLSALETASGLFGDTGSYRVVAGMRDEGSRDDIYGGLQIERDGVSLVDWEDKTGGPQEWLRGLAQGTLEALDELDLPGWADTMVAETRTAIAALDGEELGDQLGQTALSALDALNAGLAQTAAVLERLGESVLEFSGLASDSIYAITQAAGGVDAFSGMYNTYVQGFYSAEEQQALLRRQVQGQFESVGVALPETRDAFRELVDSLDLSTESGQGTFVSLMGLSGAFAQLVPAAAAAAEAVADLGPSLADLYASAQTHTDNVWAAFQDNRQKQIDSWAGQESNWLDIAADVRSVFDVLHEEVRSLYDEVDSTRAMQTKDARAFISQALDSARLTGSLPDQDKLSEAIASARNGLDSSAFATRAEYEVAVLDLAGQLAELEGIAGTQLSAAERAAKHAGDMVDLLTQEQDYWQEQFELLRQTNTSLGTIAELSQALLDERKAKEDAERAKANAAGGKGSGGGASFAGGGKIAGGGNGYDEYTTQADAAARAAEINAGGGYAYTYNTGGAWRVVDEGMRGGSGKAETLRDALNTANGADDWWSTAAKTGATLDDIAMAMGADREDMREWVKQNLPGYNWGAGNSTLQKIPGFAVGTSNVPRDMLSMVHEGEIIVPRFDSEWFRSKAGNTDALTAQMQTVGALLSQISEQLTQHGRTLTRTANAVNGAPEQPVPVETV